MTAAYMWIIAVSRLDLSGFGPGTHGPWPPQLHPAVSLEALDGYSQVANPQTNRPLIHTCICTQFLFK